MLQTTSLGETSAAAINSPYVGRFAPSPTGPLHFGSLIAAVGSYLEARSQRGRWLVRIEDIDTTRAVPGAADTILRQLDAYGFAWDGPVVYQSQRLSLYEAALERLSQNDMSYACSCTRREIAELTSNRVYPGLCRRGALHPDRPVSIRVRVPNQAIEFTDRIQGVYRQHLASEVGDFIIRRTDGLYAYQLAVVVDDAEQGVNHIVRGCDLLDSTPRQIHLQRLLEYSAAAYLHLPVVIDETGYKLSKQTGAEALSIREPGQTLATVLVLLGQNIPAELARWTPAEIWQWAQQNWQWQAIPRAQSITRITEDRV